MAEARQGKSTGRRRPNAPKFEKRTEMVQIALSPSELFRVQLAARNMGVSVPHFYELCAWSGDADAAGELVQLRRELQVSWRMLAGAANNLNQMAHYANAAGELHPDTDAVRAQLVEAMDDLQRLIERVSAKVG